jgi:hypothetical protein
MLTIDISSCRTYGKIFLSITCTNTESAAVISTTVKECAVNDKAELVSVAALPLTLQT